MKQRAAARRAIPTAPLKALIFDSWYDSYRGVVMLVRVFEGTLAPKQKIRFMVEQEGVRGPGAGRLRARSRAPVAS